MVRSRTPKITLHTEEAKCILYDTSPDFEVNYYNGTKTFISKDGSIKIFEYNGNTITIESNSRSTCLTPQAQEILEKSSRWHQYCLEEEKIREKRHELYKDIISFPISIGRKPQINKISILSHGNSNNNSMVILSSNNQLKHEDSINQVLMKTTDSCKISNYEKDFDIHKIPTNEYKKIVDDSENIESKYLNIKSASTSSLLPSPNYSVKYSCDLLDKPNQYENENYDYYQKSEYIDSTYDLKSSSNFSLNNLNNDKIVNTSNRPLSSSSYNNNINFSNLKKEQVQQNFSQNSNYELNLITSHKSYNNSNNSVIPRSASASINYSQQTNINSKRSTTPSYETSLTNNFQHSINMNSNQNAYSNYNNLKNSLDNIPINLPQREINYTKY
jgi:hypothetical protein